MLVSFFLQSTRRFAFEISFLKWIVSNSFWSHLYNLHWTNLLGKLVQYDWKIEHDLDNDSEEGRRDKRSLYNLLLSLRAALYIFLVDTAAVLMEKRSVIFMVRAVLAAILGFVQNVSLTKVF